MKAKDRQTLMDIAVSSCGDVEAVFEIAENNDLSLTVELSGIEIDVPEKSNQKVADYFADNGITPATASDKSEETQITSNDGNYILMSNDGHYILTINI